MVYWLVPCLIQDWCMRTMVWVAMLPKNMSVGLHFCARSYERKFYTGKGKSFLQSEFISSRWITQILRHLNEAGEFTAGT